MRLTGLVNHFPRPALSLRPAAYAAETATRVEGAGKGSVRLKSPVLKEVEIALLRPAAASGQAAVTGTARIVALHVRHATAAKPLCPRRGFLRYLRLEELDARRDLVRQFRIPRAIFFFRRARDNEEACTKGRHQTDS